MTELEVTSLLIELANLDVTGIAISYDGSGDSGAIENIVYTREKCETSEDVESVIDDIWSGEGLSNVSQDAYIKIEAFAYDVLNDIEDWWNNEGGFGYMYIHIPTGKYHIANNVRITNVESFGHEGNLMEKTKED